MATISSEHLALLTATETGARVNVWRSSEVRGVINEAAIDADWLPSEADGWEDIRAEILLSEGIEARHDGRGYTISFTVAEEARQNWADDRAVALTAEAWDGAAWQGRWLIAWGYLDGRDTQRLDANGDQTAERVATYDGYWDRTQVPPHRFGRVNLATGATVAGSTDALASTTDEAGLEYISQSDNEPSRAIDEQADTVYIADIIADPTQPTIGDSAEVHILRAYNGNETMDIGAGGEPKFIELCYVHRAASWGAMTSSGAVPNIHETESNVRNDDRVTSTIVTSGPFGAYYQVQAKTGSPDPRIMSGVQWNFGVGAGGVPAKMVLEYKAASPGSVGRRMHVTMKAVDPFATAIQRDLALSASWQSQDFDIDDTTNYAGLMLRFQNTAGEIAASDLYFAFRFTIWLGYSDLNASGGKLHLSYDNGAGFQDTRRIAWDLANEVEDWRIPPLGTVIITDDISTFRAKFDPGNRQVWQMRNRDPLWFFGPGQGKIALRRGNGFNYHQYAPSGYTLVEEINFETNGLDWLPYQGLSRQSPIGTGALAVEDYPHVGLLPGSYGGGFLWLDLHEYAATRLAQPLGIFATAMTVDDAERLAVGQQATIGTERVLLTAVDDATYTIARAQDGTTAAAHDPGDTVTPRLAGADQTGPQWDSVELRRKPGTPPIKSGVLIASNLSSPGDPSSGGSLWERHPDWFLVTRFDNQSRADVISLRPAGGPLQARHICVGDVLMHRLGAIPQRFKLNEIIVREYLPGATTAGGWIGHGASNVAEAAAHMLTQHGGVPSSKVTITASPAPMGDLPITGATLAQILDNLEGDGEQQIWLDPANAVVIAPDTSSPQYDSREPYLTLDNSLTIGGVSVAWGVRQPVAQIRMTAREVGALRTYQIAYPDIPGRLGEIVEIKDVLVRSWAEGRDKAERRWRARNTRRTPQTIEIGPSPWARPFLRVVWNAERLDASDQVLGVNCAIVSFAHIFKLTNGGPVWTTQLTLQEIVL